MRPIAFALALALTLALTLTACTSATPIATPTPTPNALPTRTPTAAPTPLPIERCLIDGRSLEFDAALIEALRVGYAAGGYPDVRLSLDTRATTVRYLSGNNWRYIAEYVVGVFQGRSQDAHQLFVTGYISHVDCSATITGWD